MEGPFLIYIHLHTYTLTHTHTHTHTHTDVTCVTKLSQQVFIYNDEIQCTSHTSCTQVLEFPQSHFGDNQEGTFFS